MNSMTTVLNGEKILVGSENISRYSFGETMGIETYGTKKVNGVTTYKIGNESKRDAESIGFTVLSYGRYYVYVAKIN